MKIYFQLFILFFVCINVSVSYAYDTKIRLAYSDAKAFPYQIHHENNPPGIAMEIISQAAQDIGIDIEFLRLPNKRVQ